MFARKPRQPESFSSRYGAGKSTARTKRSFQEHSATKSIQRSESVKASPRKEHSSPPVGRYDRSCSPGSLQTLTNFLSSQHPHLGHHHHLCRARAASLCRTRRSPLPISLLQSSLPRPIPRVECEAYQLARRAARDPLICARIPLQG
jgi:hypothetical protein